MTRPVHPGTLVALASRLTSPRCVVHEHRSEGFGEPLTAEEAQLEAGVAPARRRDLRDGRHCARQALAGLGVYDFSVLPRGGEPAFLARIPAWPPGIVGSITHCPGYRAAVVAPSPALIGLDAEPNAPLSDPVRRIVHSAGDLRVCAEASDLVANPDRLASSLKEIAYKAFCPRRNDWWEFSDVVIESMDRGQATLTVPPSSKALTRPLVVARWVANHGILVTLIEIQPEERRVVEMPGDRR